MFGIHRLRHTAGITLFFFLWMTLYPALAAAVQPVSANAPVAQPSAKTPPNTLEELRDTAQRARAKAERGEDSTAEETRLLQHVEALDKEAHQAEAEFADIGRHLEAQHLPNEIKQRHTEAVADYRSNMKELKTRIKDFKAAHDRKDKTGTRRRLNELAKFLDNAQKHRHQQPFDPSNLPFSTPSGKVRAPKEKPQELETIVRPPQAVSKAANNKLIPGLLPANAPGATPTADDLAETEDVQLSQAIKDQAAALNNNPVEIYNFVRNSIEFLPTYGSIQGSDLTLQSQRGNAFDTASLLIALLRAANIPARYAYGTVQIPIDHVMNWVGGVTNPMAALELLGQGGIPNTGITQGGVIKSVKLEHVWVEAFVDYIPSRGAKHKVGDTWTPLDASFKRYDYTAYVDLREDSPFNAQAFLDVFNNGSTSNLQEGWLSNVNVPALETAYQQANTEINGWLDRVLGEGKDWRRLQRVIFTDYPMLMGSLPYKVITQASTYSSIPESQRRSFRFDLYASDRDRSDGNALFSYRSSLPALSAKRLTLGFAPATDADWAVIKSYLPNLPQGQALTPADLPSTLPGNLIRLTAVLLLDDQPIKRGGRFSMGQDVFSTTAISRLTGGFHEARNTHLAGEFLAIGIDLQGYGENQLVKAPIRTTVSVLHQVAKAYFYRRDIHLEYLRLLGQAAAYPAPSFGFFGTSLTPRYRFGIPTQVKLNSVQVDVDAAAQILVSLDNDPDAKIRLTEQLGMVLSAREHEIPESHLANDQYPGQGVSAVNALSAALAQGQRVYRITSANLESALAQAELSPEIETDVRNAVSAGQAAVIHERPIVIGGWTGAGYILTDPRTGAGAYRIAGGLNGGAMETEVAEGLAFSGLSRLAGDAVALLEFAIPAAHADEGVCGEAEKERVQVSSFALELLFSLALQALLIGTLLNPVVGPAILVLIAVFASTAAVAQARKNECYVYYIGNVTPDAKDISELAAHILSAIEAKQAANLGTGIANLTYASSKRKTAAGANRQWYNNPKNVGDLEDSPCNDPKLRNGQHCDEYPFFSTHQGGAQSYPDGVSLKLVNARQNQLQGSTLGAFYRACFGFEIGTAFAVKSADGGITHGEKVTRDGKTTCWPRPDVPLYVPLTDNEEELFND